MSMDASGSPSSCVLSAHAQAALYAWLHPLEVEALKNAQADLQGAH